MPICNHSVQDEPSHDRLQQPVQNPISDHTNVLWNSPSLGQNYSDRLPLVL